MRMRENENGYFVNEMTKEKYEKNPKKTNQTTFGWSSSFSTETSRTATHNTQHTHTTHTTHTQKTYFTQHTTQDSASIKPTHPQPQKRNDSPHPILSPPTHTQTQILKHTQTHTLKHSNSQTKKKRCTHTQLWGSLRPQPQGGSASWLQVHCFPCQLL